MCVIISRQPGIDIPFEKLQSACHVNGDGWGASVIDRGRIETIRAFDPKGNDPQAITRLLEQAKDNHVFIHLRFCTVGTKNLDNTHPFISMTKAEDGQDILLMHNGTLQDYQTKGSDLSDTHHFNEKIVKPLLKHCRGDVLDDPFVETVLQKFAGWTSILTLYDGDGRELIINKDRGKTYQGWWASNEYSFNSAHREPVKQDNWFYKHNNTNIKPGDYERIAWEEVYTPPKDKALPPPVPKAMAKPSVLTSIPPRTRRATFTELTGIKDLRELTTLDISNIETLVDTYPLECASLIADLLYILDCHKAIPVDIPNVVPTQQVLQ